ncbi:MAG: DUF447 family protein [Proteobacteria bacterium]|nr:DUF447 family protein [Pseudomonadota bacterium]
MIYETIITTRNADGTVHIAPMGIHIADGRYMIQPFKPSTTLDNLLRTKQAIINMTDDVMIFAGCLTGRRDWPTRQASSVDGELLDAALAHVEVEVTSVEEDELRPRFYCNKVYEQTHAPFKGFNRGQAAVLEAAILVSRLSILSQEKIKSEIDYLKIAIDKTAGEKEKTAWAWLMTRIEEHEKEKQETTQ